MSATRTDEAFADTLRRYSFTFASESELQAAVGDALSAEGISFEREVILTPGDRIDFLLACGVGLEIKVAGSVSSVASQLLRYAGTDRVSALILVTARQIHRCLPSMLHDKPLHVLVAGSMNPRFDAVRREAVR